jgi:hypothetical protein
VGVGASVKAEANRLGDEHLLPRGLLLVPWNAGSSPQDPEKRVIPDDRQSPLNKEFYENMKAQAWWSLRRRFELTYRAITELRAEQRGPGLYDKFTWQEADLISLPSDLPLSWKLVKELSQPTMTRSGRLKLMIEKAPEGTKSPNLADAVAMAFFPENPVRLCKSATRCCGGRGSE